MVRRRDFRLLTGIPDPDHPTPQPVLWFSEELQPEVRDHLLYTPVLTSGHHRTYQLASFHICLQ